MALAKYCEDIVDRLSDDNWERIHAFFAIRNFDKEWRESKRVESAAVAAQFKDRYFEDRMVFLRSAKTRFNIICASKEQPVVVQYTRRSQASEVLFPDTQGHYQILAPKEDGELKLQCGFYTKNYSISFLDKPKPETLPNLQLALAALVSNPARWTSAGFEKLRSELEFALAIPGIPADFAMGVKEFYLGLFHESIGERNFRKRLETAFNILRPFSPYSDYATLICAYYLFRVNCFEQVASLKEIPTLSRIAQFFLEPLFLASGKTRSQPAPPVGTEILVSDRDFALFHAVTSFLSDDMVTCSEQLDISIRAEKVGLDPQGDERIAIVRARLAMRSDKIAAAKLLYGTLSNSATEAFRLEAEKILKS